MKAEDMEKDASNVVYIRATYSKHQPKGAPFWGQVPTLQGPGTKESKMMASETPKETPAVVFADKNIEASPRNSVIAWATKLPTAVKEGEKSVKDQLQDWQNEGGNLNGATFRSSPTARTLFSLLYLGQKSSFDLSAWSIFLFTENHAGRWFACLFVSPIDGKLYRSSVLAKYGIRHLTKHSITWYETKELALEAALGHCLDSTRDTTFCLVQKPVSPNECGFNSNNDVHDTVQARKFLVKECYSRCTLQQLHGYLSNFREVYYLETSSRKKTAAEPSRVNTALPRDLTKLLDDCRNSET